ncbi:hypothetical protein AAAT68_03350 [Lawsonibacter asaccharolyticus]
MKKRLLSLFLCATALISLFSINSFASFNSISSIYENKNQNTTTINTMSEYEIAVQESLQFQRSGQSGEDPLAAYERAFKKLCELPADMLMNNGYSSEEVSLMKAYLSGSVSFDVAAMRASASLSSDLRCTKHTSTQYTCVYSWEWDKIPAGEDTAGYALTMVGINENSQSIETKKVAQNSSVYYYNEDGTYYKYETPSTTVRQNYIVCYYDKYKINDEGDSRIWAKRGNVSYSVTPVISVNYFEALRAQGAYFSSDQGGVDISVSFSYGVASISASTTILGSDVGPRGEEHCIYYNDGTEEPQ